MNNLNWADIIEALSSPIELQTGKQQKWFRASEKKGYIFIDNAVDHRPSCELSMPRPIRADEYIRMYPYYQRWMSGEPGVRMAALNESQNSTYIFALMSYFENKNHVG